MESGERQPILNIEGETVALGPLRRDLLPLYEKWGNDFRANVTLGTMAPATTETVAAWYERACQHEPRSITFTIYLRDGLRPVGTANLHEIDPAERSAGFGIAIGEPDCWGRGYGTEVTRLMLEYGFVCLGLHNIMLRVYDFNQRGIAAYRHAGFREIGRRREAHWLAGRAHDIVLMDCLATEFTPSALRALLP